jgi:hypothetical protein
MMIPSMSVTKPPLALFMKNPPVDTLNHISSLVAIATAFTAYIVFAIFQPAQSCLPVPPLPSSSLLKKKYSRDNY